MHVNYAVLIKLALVGEYYIWNTFTKTQCLYIRIHTASRVHRISLCVHTAGRMHSIGLTKISDC